MRFSTILVVLSAAFATTSAAPLETRQDGYASSSPHQTAIALAGWLTTFASLGCAIPCLIQTDPGLCSLADTGCLCRNQQFVQQANACVEANCSGTDLEQSVATAVAACLAVVSRLPCVHFFPSRLTRHRVSP